MSKGRTVERKVNHIILNCVEQEKQRKEQGRQKQIEWRKMWMTDTKDNVLLEGSSA